MATALKGGGVGEGSKRSPRSNATLFFSNAPSVLAIFVKNKQNAWDIRKKKKRGKSEKTKKFTVFKKLKNWCKIAKTAKHGKIKVG